MPEETPTAVATNPAALAEQLAACLADSLETMAFITLQPADGSSPAVPNEPVRVSIQVRGPMRGVVEIAAPMELGAQLAANIIEPGAVPPDAAAQNADALRELANVVCGCFLRASAPPGCEMELPALEPIDAEEWRSLTADRGTVVVDAEGSLVAVRTMLALAC
jgi:hypothetical protein